MADFGEMLLRMMGVGGATGRERDQPVTPYQSFDTPSYPGFPGSPATTDAQQWLQNPPTVNDNTGGGTTPSSSPETPPNLSTLMPMLTGRSVATGDGTTGAPATTIAPPPGAGAVVPPGAGTSIGGPATPPDLSALYTKLVADQKRDANFNQGINLIAAGFARPENRAALIGLPTNNGPDPAAALQTMMALRNDQIKQTNTATDRAALPGIATKLGIDVPTATTLYNSGKLGDVLSDVAKPHTQISGDAKSGYRLVDLRTGNTIREISPPIEKSESDPTVAEKKIAAAQENWQKYNLPDPNDPVNSGFWKDFSTKILAPGGGQTINVGDNQFDKMAAEKIYIPAAQAGMAAMDANHTISTMKNLALTGGNDLPSGPAALLDLKTREGLGAFLGVSIAGVPEAEGIQKLNQALATASVKAISSRPTQMEFAKALENNPGLLQSRAGMLMMMEILKQDNEAKSAIGGMAMDKSNHGANWISTVDKYYQAHPLMSPFDKSKAFGKDDIDILSDPQATKIVEGKMYYKKGDGWFKADSSQ